MNSLKLGCIADDFTGATDLANNLTRAGMRVVQTLGVPRQALQIETDAVVVALKSRTAPVAHAVASSLVAARWLSEQGAKQIYFKYCSTFDSIYQGQSRGNIGPVTEALMDALRTDFTVATPAFPDNARTVYKGNLFVGDLPLAESGMRDHPLTPMTDSNLVRIMQAQCRRKVGLVDYNVVTQGPGAVRERLQALRAQGVGIAILDALCNADLLTLGAAVAQLPLVTAGSGLAIGLPANFAIQPSSAASALPKAKGFKAIVSGSCSQATQAQVQHFVSSGLPTLALDPLSLAQNDDAIAHALAWTRSRLGSKPLLIYSTADPASVHSAQNKLGVQAAGTLVESALSRIAVGLVAQGVGQLVVAGGETSGACAQALGIERMQIGPQVAPGVPWCYADTNTAGTAIHILLKSGNFGQESIFTSAFGALA